LFSFKKSFIKISGYTLVGANDSMGLSIGVIGLEQNPKKQTEKKKN
jgi:hypothetical protein